MISIHEKVTQWQRSLYYLSVKAFKANITIRHRYKEIQKRKSQTTLSYQYHINPDLLSLLIIHENLLSLVRWLPLVCKSYILKVFNYLLNLAGRKITRRQSYQNDILLLLFLSYCLSLAKTVHFLSSQRHFYQEKMFYLMRICNFLIFLRFLYIN